MELTSPSDRRYETIAPLRDPSSEIRLLYIHKGEFEDPIACEISCHMYIFTPAFRAISYTWGQLLSGRHIKVGDELWSVGENCYYALQQARHFHPNSYVWIDTICINQTDLEEKSAQVAIMGDIYWIAVEVLACIGPADESSEYVRQKLPILNQIIQHFPDEWQLMSDDEANALWQPPNGENAILHLADHWDVFCKRPYFHRLWVIQELYEGRQRRRDRLCILCGMVVLGWDDLSTLQLALHNCFNISTGRPLGNRGSCSDIIMDLASLLTMNEVGDFDLAQFMERTGRFGCQDPRDRIYGTLRLIDWGGLRVTRPEPDYNVSILDLGIQLMNGFRDDDFAQIIYLATTLELNRCSWETGLTEGKHGHSGVLYTTAIFGAARIEQDANGRLTAPLMRKDTKPHWTSTEADHLASKLSTDDDKHPHQIFTNGRLAALAGPDVQAGDFIVRAPFFDLILRLQHDLSFRLTGKAVLLNPYHTRNLSDWTCGCWPIPNEIRYDISFIKLSFEASAREALTYASYCIEDDLQSVAQRVALDFPKLGSTMRDMFDSERKTRQTIRPVETTCQEHDAAACSIARRNGLLFCVASGCGRYVEVELSDPSKQEM